MANVLKGAVEYKKFLKKELDEDPKLKKSYDDLELEFQVIHLLLKQRRKKNLTQAQIAKKLGVRQPLISQFEQGKFNPSVKFLKRLAKALDAKLTITLS